MIRALLYLRVTSLRNLVLSRLRRLRQPKYLIGALVAVGYFYTFVFRHAHGAFRPGAGPAVLTQLPAETAPLILGFGALALLAVVLAMWILPNDQPGFRFSEAEIAFLFPAPISRRGLVHYKLVSTLFSSLLQTLFFAALFNGRALLTGRGGYLLVSWWLVLSFISLHYLGSSLTIARLAEQGLRARVRRWALLGIVLLIAVVAGAWIWLTLPSLLLAPSVAEWLQSAFATGALRWLLWPTRLLLHPFFAQHVLGFVLAVLPALAVLGLQYLWVVRMNVSFEEASIASAERRAARLAELRRSGGIRTQPVHARGRRPAFNLARTPWPEAAFVWKNLLSTRRWCAPRVWLASAVLLIGLSVALHRLLGNEYWRAGGALAGLGTFAAGMTLFYGPLLLRLDLRQDLINADILKAYPLAGWRIVLGELLAPTAVLSAIVWLAVLAWYLGLCGHQPPALPAAWFTPAMRLVWCGCAAIAAPLLLCVELLIPNAAPVVLPGWFQTLRTPGGGIDLMGQRLIFGFGQILVVAVALGVAFGAALAVHVMVRGGYVVAGWLNASAPTGPAPATTLLLWTGTVMLVLLGEVAIGVRWLGRRFERLDVSETRP